MQTKQAQTVNNVTTTIDKYLTYDHAGRLTKTEQQIAGDANGKVTVAENIYNEIGQLIDKKLHNNAQQSIDYRYNIRGWLTQINDPDNLANDGTGDTYADLFAERLLYNDNSTISNLTSQNQYNGNISGIIINHRNDATTATTKSAYGFAYDGLNRLNAGTYAENTGSGYSVNLNAYNEFGITYDKNGNIQTLKRNSSGTLVDNLAYTYENTNKSNHLQVVADLTGNAIGFTDVTNTSDYLYDNNGNAKQDLNKGITAISYNVLNLPNTVTKDANNSIKYVYTASGEKVMQATKVSGITTNRYYAGFFEYDNLKALALVKMDEGIVTKTSSAYVYEYYLKDHLGNTRITFSPGTSGPVLAQRTDYYPFGLAFTNQYVASSGNSYLYNGKELQKALGWQVYDYGARFYDAVILRFHTPDPMDEKYYSISPYAYCANNPIRYIDPTGMDFTEDAWKQVNKLIAEVNSRQASNKEKIAEKQAKLDAGGLSAKQEKALGRQIGRLEGQNTQLESVRGEVATLAASDQMYDVKTDNSMSISGPISGMGEDRAGAVFNFSNGNFDMLLPSGADVGFFAHELKHAYQFETGAFSSGPKGIPFYDQSDEKEAIARGALFGSTQTWMSAYNDLPPGPIDATNHPNIQFLINNPTRLQSISNQTRSAFRINGTTYKPQK